MLRRTDSKARLAYLAELCRANAEALMLALQYCATNGIGAFRITSQILPLKTHPEVGYGIDQLPLASEIVAAFRACGEFARQNQIRLSFHPDQFVVLNSPRATTVAASVAELVYQAEVAEWIGADVINLHGGGGYGNKPASLLALRRSIDQLPENVRSKLTLENDDRVFTPSDLLPVCADTGIPLVYDVHHHRCLKDHLSVEEATVRAAATWTREPLFHISSPIAGWNGPDPSRHADYIDSHDWPDCWNDTTLTVEVEAKAKELAVKKLQQELSMRRLSRTRPARSKLAF